MELKDGIKIYYAKDRNAWRQWLIKNHLIESSVWLIIFKKESNTPSIYYPEAVDEALCFGWIDSKPNKRDDHSYYQFFSKRKPKSNWSPINKIKVEKLIKDGLMTPAGMKTIDWAKKSGTWNALDKVYRMEMPDDLVKEFNKNKIAFNHWSDFPPSTKKGILEWILNAKQQDTRSKRIKETVDKAAQNIRANQYTPKAK